MFNRIGLQVKRCLEQRSLKYSIYLILTVVAVVTMVLWMRLGNQSTHGPFPRAPHQVPMAFVLGAILFSLSFAIWVYLLRGESDLSPPEVVPDAKPLETSIMHTLNRSEIPAVPPVQPPFIHPEVVSVHKEKSLPLRVLVVDDDASNRMILRKQLRRLGIESQSAHDGMAAVEAALDEHWDMILMDGQMPNMDGIEATREIRARSLVNSETIIIAVTGNSLTGYRERCLEAGMDGFCSKPLRLTQLRNLLEQYAVVRSPQRKRR